MATAYIDILRRHDDPVRWEYPAGFNYDRAVKRFRGFAGELASLWDKPIEIETESHIQDASFHSQIRIPVRDDEFVLVRFSNFGDMATFAEEVAVPDQLRQALLRMFEKHGYIYVPAEVLEQPYSGSNPGVTGIRDWWIRYFDWV
jgi:hypothetical protein